MASFTESVGDNKFKDFLLKASYATVLEIIVKIVRKVSCFQLFSVGITCCRFTRRRSNVPKNKRGKAREMRLEKKIVRRRRRKKKTAMMT